MKKLVSIQEAAEMLSVSLSFLFRAAEDGTIPSVKLGRRRMMRVEDVEAIARDGCGSRGKERSSRRRAGRDREPVDPDRAGEGLRRTG